MKETVLNILCALFVILTVLILCLTFGMDFAMDIGNRELSLYLAVFLLVVLSALLIVIFLGVRMVKKEKVGNKKLKMPTNDEECRAVLRDVCGRTEEQIDAIFQFAKLTKELKKSG